MYSQKIGVITIISIFIIGMAIQGVVASQDASKENRDISLRDQMFLTSQDSWLPNQYSMNFSTFLGGNGDEDRGSIAVTESNDIVVAFPTESTDLTTTEGAYQSEYAGLGDIFLAKFAPNGSLLFSTYVGGNQTDYVNSVSIASSGRIVLSGWTRSTDYPITAGAIQETHGGDIDGFITVLNCRGERVIASTFLGGIGEDIIHGCKFDSSNNIIFSGYSTSEGMATSGVYQETLCGFYDSIIGKINPDLDELLALTYVGGSSRDTGYGLVIDESDSVIFTGLTVSTDYPLMNEFQDSVEGFEDIFVSKLDSNLETLQFSTYIAGNEQDNPKSIDIDCDGNILITGLTRSTNLPVVNAIQDTFGGNQDLFVLKLSADCQEILFLTYWGGSMFESSWGITSDSTGRIIVHGDTSSTDFDVALTEEFELQGSRDGFVTVFESDGQSKNCSFVLGGDGVEYGSSVVIDSEDNIIITGKTKSTDFPVTNAYQNIIDADYDFYVSKFAAPLPDVTTGTDTNSGHLGLESVLILVAVTVGIVMVVVVVIIKKR
ncbi:MAG: SBBP repeat-containing protein [Candidatus Thorarchaeota archaeon]